MTFASDHCAKQFAHSAPGLLGAHSYGPPPLFGPERRKTNVFYIDAPVIVLPDTRIASGEEVKIYQINDHRGYSSIPLDPTSQKILTVVVIPESLDVKDYVHLSFGTQPLSVLIPAELKQLVPRPDGNGVMEVKVPLTQAKPVATPVVVTPPAVVTVTAVPANPSPPVTAPTKPQNGRTNGNGSTPVTIPIIAIDPTTNRQIPVASPTDPQLVVYENNPANPNYKRLLSIPPGQARGIGLPAWKIVSSLPAVGGVAGEAVFDTSTKSAHVWDGSTWQAMPPRALIPTWDPTLSYTQDSIVQFSDNLWIAKAAIPLNSQPAVSSLLWSVIGPSRQSKFEEYDTSTQYLAGDHAYVYSSLFEALNPSIGDIPTWAETTTNWKYVGNYLVYNPVGNDQTDGSVPTYIGGKYILQKPQGINRTSGKELSYQAGSTLSTPPKRYLKLSSAMGLNGSAACWIPSIIMNSNGWQDLSSASNAAEDQMYSAFNQENGVYAYGFLNNAGKNQVLVSDFNDAAWGHSADGFRTAPSGIPELFAAGTENGGRRGSSKLTFEAHVNDDDGRWDCHYRYVGAMGLDKSNYGVIEMGWSWPGTLFNSLTQLGFKMHRPPGKTQNINIPIRWQCEWE